MIVEELKKNIGLEFRPKSHITINRVSVIINCYPQQHWKLLTVYEDPNTVKIEYKMVTMMIYINDFIDNWRLV